MSLFDLMDEEDWRLDNINAGKDIDMEILHSRCISFVDECITAVNDYLDPYSILVGKAICQDEINEIRGMSILLSRLGIISESEYDEFSDVIEILNDLDINGNDNGNNKDKDEDVKK